MNRFILYIIFSCFFSNLLGQPNLVYNGSFEEYSQCPTTNELNNGQFENAVGWFRPTLGTPDYFHRCNYDVNVFHTVGVPENLWGYQEPFHGDAYVGFVPIEWDDDGNYVLGGEYIRTKLISTLKPCMKYRFRMYVSLADLSTHGVGKLGAFFSVDNTTFFDDVPIIVEPQIVYDGNPIVDTVEWVKVEAEFVASGFEKFLTIGYFRSHVNNDTTFVQNNPFFNAPYYYVDSVSLIEIGVVSEDLCDLGEIIFPNVVTPNNDGVNDYLDVSSYFILTDAITILNRWGSIITVLTLENPVWDATNQQGILCTEGTYFYSFSYQWGSQTKDKSGFIQLVR